MDDAGLHPGLRKHGGDRVGKAGEAVDAGDEDIGDAAAVQVVEDGRAFGVLPPQAERLAVAFDGDTDGQVTGAGAHRAVFADLHVQGIEVDDGIDGVQRPRPPRGHVARTASVTREIVSRPIWTP